MLLYHYTIGIKIPAILDTGVILTSPRKPTRPERAVAWLSSNDSYERTAMKMAMEPNGTYRMLSLSEMDAHAGGVWRIVFDSADIRIPISPWVDIWKSSRMGFAMARRLERRATECGANPHDWWGSLKVIPLDRFGLQVLDVASMCWADVSPMDALWRTAGAGEGVLQASADEFGGFVPNGAFQAGAAWGCGA